MPIDGYATGLLGSFVASPPVIPKMYWDAYSDEQRWKQLWCNVKKLVEYAESIKDVVNVNVDDIKKLQDEFEKFKASGFLDYYEQLIKQWIDDNLSFIFETIAKTVMPGLTDDGYFCLYVSASWSEVMFDTIADYANENYGCLVLRY